jgi:hypothetical protein
MKNLLHVSPGCCGAEISFVNTRGRLIPARSESLFVLMSKVEVTIAAIEEQPLQTESHKIVEQYIASEEN